MTDFKKAALLLNQRGARVLLDELKIWSSDRRSATCYYISRCGNGWCIVEAYHWELYLNSPDPFASTWSLGREIVRYQEIM